MYPSKLNVMKLPVVVVTDAKREKEWTKKKTTTKKT
jgi:hypothetical protein